MRERLAGFMAGRYGNDQLNRVISICSLVLLIASIVLKFKWPYAGVVCWYVGLTIPKFRISCSRAFVNSKICTFFI